MEALLRCSRGSKMASLRCGWRSGAVEWWLLTKITKVKEKRLSKDHSPLVSHVFPLDKRSGLTTTNTYRHICTDGTFMMFCEFLKTITVSCYARRFICLFVCLWARYLKKLWTDSDETWWTGWVCDKGELIRFWWRSKSGSGYENYLITKVILHHWEIGPKWYITWYLKNIMGPMWYCGSGITWRRYALYRVPF